MCRPSADFEPLDGVPARAHSTPIDHPDSVVAAFHAGGCGCVHSGASQTDGFSRHAFIGVYIADPRDEVGIHEHLLDAALPAGKQIVEARKREPRLQRLGAEIAYFGQIEDNRLFGA